MFDKKEDFAPLEKLVWDLQEELHMAGIPFMFTAVIKDDGNKTEWFSTGLTPGAFDIKLSDDRIRRALNVLYGFDEIIRPSLASEEICSEHIMAEEDDDAFNEILIETIQKET